MKKYEYVTLNYVVGDDSYKLIEDVESLIDLKGMMGYHLQFVIPIEYGVLGPTKIKLIFERDKY